jgi:hypothetical protein
MDILIGYDALRACAALPSIKGVLHEAEQTYKAPVEAIVLPEAALDDLDQYGIDPLMLRHLLHVQREQPEWQRNNPLPDTLTDCPPDRMTAATIARTYCNSKVQQLARALTGNDQVPDLHVMQLVLRLPSTIGRKVLPAILPYDPDERVLDKAWATDTVAQELKAADKERAAKKLGRLAALDLEYSELLESTIQGDTSTRQYGAWLAGQYMPACLLAHDISHDLGTVIRQINRTPQCEEVTVID